MTSTLGKERLSTAEYATAAAILGPQEPGRGALRRESAVRGPTPNTERTDRGDRHGKTGGGRDCEPCCQSPTGLGSAPSPATCVSSASRSTRPTARASTLPPKASRSCPSPI